ncbi:MAG: dsRNA-specific ribonuclease [Tildeniella nuda ZEHNDER 1965/U140]|jgi:ribonuclease-3|nr:dsRNA-specific ribonuclease [Tildeniella nuda ZEHNDER 1965/U140]
MSTALEEQLGYFFFDKRILARSLTRKAYALEQRQKNQECDDQEIYRTLGDAVLKTVLTELLIRAGSSTRQDITVRKIELEREENLARISLALGIGYVLKLGIGEKQQRAYEQPYVLAESLEAVIGGIYFDGGFSAARETIRRLFKDVFPIE